MQGDPQQIGSDIDKFLKDRESLRLHVNSIFQSAGPSSKDQERIKDLVVDVWERAGSDLCNCLGYLESICLIETSCCRREYRVPLLPYEKAVDPAQIILTGLMDKSTEEIKAIIAHETAHYVLGDWKIGSEAVREKIDHLTEARADGLARKWGFPFPTVDPDKPRKNT